MFDVEAGGRLQGLLNGLNQIIDLAVPRFNQIGGTRIVPGHGWLCTESDVVEVRDMATIVRDRVQYLIQKDMTLAQVKAARPLADYEPVYGSDHGPVDDGPLSRGRLRRPEEAMGRPRAGGEVGPQLHRRRKVMACARDWLASNRRRSRWRWPGRLPPSSGAAPAPGSARAAAPLDLTGVWVSVVTEDWRWRMTTPRARRRARHPGERRRVRRSAEAWDYARDMAAGNQCKAYGAGGIMRMPTRLRIGWQDDNTLKVETDAGQQTKLLHFDRAVGRRARARCRGIPSPSGWTSMAAAAPAAAAVAAVAAAARRPRTAPAPCAW